MGKLGTPRKRRIRSITLFGIHGKARAEFVAGSNVAKRLECAVFRRFLMRLRCPKGKAPEYGALQTLRDLAALMTREPVGGLIVATVPSPASLPVIDLTPDIV